MIGPSLVEDQCANKQSCTNRHQDGKHPDAHRQPIPLMTFSTMKAEIHGVMRNGKKEIPIAKERHLLSVKSEIKMSFITLTPVCPKE
jgi:hypothetical protein